MGDLKRVRFCARMFLYGQLFQTGKRSENLVSLGIIREPNSGQPWNGVQVYGTEGFKGDYGTEGFKGCPQLGTVFIIIFVCLADI